MTWRPIRLRIVLSLLALAALFPPVILLVFAVIRAGDADKAIANDQFIAQSHNLADIFASALDANIAVVRRLASIEGEAPEELAGRAGYPTVAVAISEPAAPHTDALGWHISNLFNVVPGQSAQVTVSVDLAPLDGRPRSLDLTMDPRDLVHSIRFDSGVFPDATVAVVDGEGRVVTRSVDEDRFLGAQVPDWGALLSVGKASGMFRGQRLEGDDVTFGFTRIPHTPGWAVVVGMPTALLNSRWSEPSRLMIIGAILAALTAVLLAFLVASRISRPISALVDYARHADASAPPPARIPIAEFETLRRGFIAARTALLDRARHDELTGLPNRTVLRERLAEMLSQAHPARGGALLYMDLDHFKLANDNHGHDAGDRVLVLVADRLRTVLRPEDLATRIGGDEFAIVVAGARSIDEVLPVATRIVAQMHAPFEVGEVEIQLGASVGIAMIGTGTITVDELIKQADMALYDAKSAGRGRCSVYEPPADGRLRA